MPPKAGRRRSTTVLSPHRTVPRALGRRRGTSTRSRPSRPSAWPRQSLTAPPAGGSIDLDIIHAAPGIALTGDHEGFLGGEYDQVGAKAFTSKLREALAVAAGQLAQPRTRQRQLRRRASMVARKLPIGLGAIAAVRTMGARCCRSG